MSDMIGVAVTFIITTVVALGVIVWLYRKQKTLELELAESRANAGDSKHGRTSITIPHFGASNRIFPDQEKSSDATQGELSTQKDGVGQDLLNTTPLLSDAHEFGVKQENGNVADVGVKVKLTYTIQDDDTKHRASLEEQCVTYATMDPAFAAREGVQLASVEVYDDSLSIATLEATRKQEDMTSATDESNPVVIRNLMSALSQQLSRVHEDHNDTVRRALSNDATHIMTILSDMVVDPIETKPTTEVPASSEDPLDEYKGLVDEIENLHKPVLDAAELEKLDSECKNLREKLESATQAQTQALVQVTTLQRELEDQKSKTAAEVTDLEAALKKSKKDASTRKKKLTRLEKESKKMSADMETLQAQHAEQASASQSQVESLTKQLQSQAAEHAAVLDELNAHVAQKEQEWGALEKKLLNDLTSSSDASKAELAALRQTLHDRGVTYEKEVTVLRESKSELEATLRKTREDQASLVKSTDDKVSALLNSQQTELKQLRDECAELRKSLASVEHENVQKDDIVGALESKVDALTSDIDKHKMKSEIEHQKCLDAQTNVADLKKQLHVAFTEKTNITQSLGDLQNRIDMERHTTAKEIAVLQAKVELLEQQAVERERVMEDKAPVEDDLEVHEASFIEVDSSEKVEVVESVGAVAAEEPKEDAKERDVDEEELSVQASLVRTVMKHVFEPVSLEEGNENEESESIDEVILHDDFPVDSFLDGLARAPVAEANALFQAAMQPFREQDGTPAELVLRALCMMDNENLLTLLSWSPNSIVTLVNTVRERTEAVYGPGNLDDASMLECYNVLVGTLTVLYSCVDVIWRVKRHTKQKRIKELLAILVAPTTSKMLVELVAIHAASIHLIPDKLPRVLMLTVELINGLYRLIANFQLAQPSGLAQVGVVLTELSLRRFGSREDCNVFISRECDATSGKIIQFMVPMSLSHVPTKPMSPIVASKLPSRIEDHSSEEANSALIFAVTSCLLSQQRESEVVAKDTPNKRKIRVNKPQDWQTRARSLMFVNGFLDYCTRNMSDASASRVLPVLLEEKSASLLLDELILQTDDIGQGADGPLLLTVWLTSHDATSATIDRKSVNVEIGKFGPGAQVDVLLLRQFTSQKATSHLHSLCAILACSRGQQLLGEKSVLFLTLARNHLEAAPFVNLVLAVPQLSSLTTLKVSRSSAAVKKQSKKVDLLNMSLKSSGKEEVKDDNAPIHRGHRNEALLYKSLRSLLQPSLAAVTELVSNGIHGRTPCNALFAKERKSVKKEWVVLGLNSTQSVNFVRVQLITILLRVLPEDAFTGYLLFDREQLMQLITLAHLVMRLVSCHLFSSMLPAPDASPSKMKLKFSHKTIMSDPRLATVLELLGSLHTRNCVVPYLDTTVNMTTFAIGSDTQDAVAPLTRSVNEDDADAKVADYWSASLVFSYLSLESKGKADHTDPSTAHEYEMHLFLSSLLRRAPCLFPLRAKIMLFHELNQCKEGVDTFKIHRDDLIASSFENFTARSKLELKQHWKVEFVGEPAIDLNGVRREYATMLSKELCEEKEGLFIESADHRFYPSPQVTDKTKTQLHFCGRFFAKCLLEGVLLDIRFSSLVYKKLLGKELSYHDIASIDKDFYQYQILWVRENDIEGVLFQTFTTEDMHGKVVELCPGGENMPVTNENKGRFLDLLINYKLSVELELQLQALISGFGDVVNISSLQMFDESELELVACGQLSVDLDDMFANLVFKQDYTADHPTLGLLKQVLNEFTPLEMCHFLHFVTGSPRLPFGGFSQYEPKFTLQRILDTSRLPSASTCFNQLKLPVYKTKQELRQKLMTAIMEGSSGFTLS